jgi:phage tail-like protein
LSGPAITAPGMSDAAVLSAPSADGNCPPIASARALMRRGLAPIYQDPPDGFVMRFVQALERVLDPRVAVIDSLPAYLDHDLAPTDMVGELLRWLGFEPVGLRDEPRRRVLDNARRLAVTRGTPAGLALALHCAFPEFHFEVLDSGGTSAPSTVDVPSAAAGPLQQWLTVRCSEELDGHQREVVMRIVERHCPVHVVARLEDGFSSSPPGAAG